MTQRTPPPVPPRRSSPQLPIGPQQQPKLLAQAITVMGAVSPFVRGSQQDYAFIPASFGSNPQYVAYAIPEMKPITPYTFVFPESQPQFQQQTNYAPMKPPLAPSSIYGSSAQIVKPPVAESVMVKLPTPTELMQKRAELMQLTINKSPDPQIKKLLIEKFGEANKDNVDQKMVKIKYNEEKGTFYIERKSTILGRTIKKDLSSNEMATLESLAQPVANYHQGVHTYGPVENTSPPPSTIYSTVPKTSEQQYKKASDVTYGSLEIAPIGMNADDFPQVPLPPYGSTEQVRKAQEEFGKFQEPKEKPPDTRPHALGFTQHFQSEPQKPKRPPPTVEQSRMANTTPSEEPPKRTGPSKL